MLLLLLYKNIFEYIPERLDARYTSDQPVTLPDTQPQLATLSRWLLVG